MDPAERPNCCQLLKHGFFVHNNFAEKFTQELRMKITREMAENPLLKTRRSRSDKDSSDDKSRRRERKEKKVWSWCACNCEIELNYCILYPVINTNNRQLLLFLFFVFFEGGGGGDHIPEAPVDLTWYGCCTQIWNKALKVLQCSKYKEGAQLISQGFIILVEEY